MPCCTFGHVPSRTPCPPSAGARFASMLSRQEGLVIALDAARHEVEELKNERSALQSDLQTKASDVAHLRQTVKGEQSAGMQRLQEHCQELQQTVGHLQEALAGEKARAAAAQRHLEEAEEVSDW